MAIIQTSFDPDAFGAPASDESTRKSDTAFDEAGKSLRINKIRIEMQRISEQTRCNYAKRLRNWRARLQHVTVCNNPLARHNYIQGVIEHYQDSMEEFYEYSACDTYV